MIKNDEEDQEIAPKEGPSKSTVIDKREQMAPKVDVQVEIDNRDRDLTPCMIRDINASPP